MHFIVRLPKSIRGLFKNVSFFGSEVIYRPFQPNRMPSPPKGKFRWKFKYIPDINQCNSAFLFRLTATVDMIKE